MSSRNYKTHGRGNSKKYRMTVISYFTWRMVSLAWAAHGNETNFKKYILAIDLVRRACGDVGDGAKS